MKSPIKRRPLRNPGDSLEDEIQEVVWRQFAVYYFFAGFLVVVAGLEWLRWFIKSGPNPILFSLIALFAVALATYKIRGAVKRVRNLKLGRDGEKAVGQFLERLRERGAQVIHDFPGEKFNIDHVVVHHSGVYAIETSRRIGPSGEPRIWSRDENIYMGVNPLVAG